MLVISDTSPISSLIIINRLSILAKVFSEIIIPDKVYNEILILATRNYDLSEFKNSSWIHTKSISNISEYNVLLKSIDAGEAEAIVLAKETSADFILIDETKGRSIARLHGIKTIGLLGVLLRAKEKGHIESVREMMDELKSKANFWLSDEVYKMTLNLANEL